MRQHSAIIIIQKLHYKKSTVNLRTLKNWCCFQQDYLTIYNTALWWQHYLCHLKQIEGMHAIGDISVISDYEMHLYMPEFVVLNEMDIEAGCSTPPSWIEFGKGTAICR